MFYSIISWQNSTNDTELCHTVEYYDMAWLDTMCHELIHE